MRPPYRDPVLLFLTVLLAGLLALGLASCGGDDATDPVNTTGTVDDGDDDDDPVEYDDLTVESVTGALAAVDDAATLFYATLDAEGVEAAALAAKAYLEAQEAVDTATIEDDNSLSILCANGIVISLGGVTWERVDTGQRGSVDLSDPGLPAGGEATPSSIVLAPDTVTLPASDLNLIAAMIDTCLGGPEGGGEGTTEIFRDAQVDVAKVQEVMQAGYGVIFWVGHGTVVDGACHLVTGEVYNTEAMAQQAVAKFGEGLLPGEGGRLLSIARVKGSTKWALCIAPAFVETFGNFDVVEGSGLGGNQVKSFAHISACYSVSGMKDAFLAAGTDVYLGWTYAVDDAWGAGFDQTLVQAACDTATILEALQIAQGEHGRVCPEAYYDRQARMQIWGDGNVMIRAQMRLTKAGAELRGYSVGVLEAAPNSVACYAADQLFAEPRYGITCNFPDQGTWNCVTDENAEIVFWDFNAIKMYIVSKGYQGVSGTIEVSSFGEEKTYGTFSGTLGWWGYSSNPDEDPPVETLEIANGTFKYTGAPQ